MPNGRENAIQRSRSDIGAQIMLDALERECKREKIITDCLDDPLERKIHAMRGMRYAGHLQRFIRSIKEGGAKGNARKALREQAQRLEIKAELTNDPAQRAKYKEEAARLMARREEI